MGAGLLRGHAGGGVSLRDPCQCTSLIAPCISCVEMKGQQGFQTTTEGGNLTHTHPLPVLRCPRMPTSPLRALGHHPGQAHGLAGLGSVIPSVVLRGPLPSGIWSVASAQSVKYIVVA